MLKSLRKAHKYVVWAVVVCFMIWGVQSVGTYFIKKGRIAGEVFGKEVSFQEYNRFYRAAEIFSPAGAENQQDAEKLREQAWQNIILSREAKREHIEVGDDEVRSQILKLLTDSKITDPSPEIYRRWLQSIRETPPEFEKKVREYLRIQKLMRKINGEPILPPTDDQVRSRFQLENSSLSLAVAEFPNYEEAANFKSKISSAADWEKAVTGLKEGQLQTIQTESFEGLIKTWHVPDFIASRLFSLDKDAVSDPFPVVNEFAVARITDKLPAEDAKLTDEMKTKYREELAEMAKFQRFMMWNMKLRERADLKDHLPRSPEEENPPPAEPNF